MSYGEFRDQRSQAYCEAMFRCCPGKTGSWADVAACVKAVNGAPGAQAIHEGLSRGSIRFDAAAGARCLDATKSQYASCDQTVDPSAADCEDVVVGVAAIGKACVQDVDCAADAFCRPVTTLDGTCAARAGMGAVCSGTPCVRGLVCLVSNTCGAALEAGKVCEQNGQCKSEICSGQTMMDRTCATLPTLRVALCGS